MEKKSVGLTKSAGYQVGVRRTFNFSVDEIWNFLLSRNGLVIWLGTHELDKWETSIEFSTDAGVSGQVRVFKLYSHIRLDWKPAHWKNSSILQLRTLSSGRKTTVSFHQEHLQDARQRNEMKNRWVYVLDEIECAMNARKSMQ